MLKYLITVNPGHNRIYFRESLKLAVSELELAFGAMEGHCSGACHIRLAGIDYISFESESALGVKELAVIAGLSFTFAVYRTDDMKCLYPAELPNTAFLDPSLSEILRYTGKTNEIFTRLLINTALFASAFQGEERIRILDPLMGKGTTLFEGLVLGMDVSGVEISEGAVSESVQYLKKFLERGKLKHTHRTEKISGENRSFRSVRHEFAVARSKEEMKTGPRSFTAVCGDTVNTDSFFKKNHFHIIAADLPYGVQHGNVSGGRASGKTRNPENLLREALPGWNRVLKKGGAVSLSWNTFVLSRERMAGLLEEAGFTVIEPPQSGFCHRVDSAISRDIITALKG